MKYAYLLALCLLAAACASPDEFIRAYDAANADGIITQEEAETLAALFKGGNWEQAAWSVASIAGALVGVRIAPNAMILGKKTAGAIKANGPQV